MDLRDAAYRVSGLIPELALTLLLSLSELLTFKEKDKNVFWISEEPRGFCQACFYLTEL